MIAVQHHRLSLRGLPAEIRLEIYAYALQKHSEIYVSSRRPPIPFGVTRHDHLANYGADTIRPYPAQVPGLLRVGQGIRCEALPVWFEVNTSWAEAGYRSSQCWHVNKGFLDWTKRIGDNVSRLQSVHLRQTRGAFEVQITLKPGKSAKVELPVMNPLIETWTSRGRMISKRTDTSQGARDLLHARVNSLLPEDGRFTVESLERICLAVF